MTKKELERQFQKKAIYEALLRAENCWITMSRMKLSSASYHKLKKEVMQEIKAIQQDQAGDIGDLLNVRLADLYNKTYKKINQGDLKAIEQGRKILADQAKLNRVGAAEEDGAPTENLVDSPMPPHDIFTNKLQELYNEVSEQLLDD